MDRDLTTETELRTYRSSIEARVNLLREERYEAVVIAIAKVMGDALLAGRRIYWFGNGGSAADAQHLAAEFTGRFLRERPGLSSEALTTNSSSITAIANDFGFDAIFSRQIEAMAVPGDVVVGISTSGRSANVIAGIEEARKRGATTIAFSGNGGGPLAGCVDIALTGPSGISALVQEVHIALGHIICDLVEQRVLAASPLVAAGR